MMSIGCTHDIGGYWLKTVNFANWPDMARWAKFFGGDAASWWVMQANDDLKTLLTLTDIKLQVPVRAQLAA